MIGGKKSREGEYFTTYENDMKFQFSVSLNQVLLEPSMLIYVCGCLHVVLLPQRLCGRQILKYLLSGP